MRENNEQVVFVLGMLLLEYVTLDNAEGVNFWNGLHFFNVPGKNFPTDVALNVYEYIYIYICICICICIGYVYVWVYGWRFGVAVTRWS